MNNRQEYLMTGSGTVAMPPQAMPEEPESDVMNTRFGQVTVYRKNPIVFPNGLLGIPDKFSYCLTRFPSEKLARFKLLQSLEDADLSFITLPIEMDNAVVAREDIITACKEIEMNVDDLTMLLIVTVHRTPSAVRLSVNARAPLLLDASNRTAVQFVFPNPKYDVRHMISA